MYASNDTFAAYSGEDIINTQAQEGLTMSQATWRNYAGTIVLLGDEVRQNSGDGKLIDLLKAKTMQAVMSLKNKLNTDLFASSQAAKAIHCLPVLVDATSTVQGINSTTYSWWQAQVVASGSFAGRGLQDLRNLRDLIIRAGQSGGSAPDSIVTTQAILEYYEASQVPALRYASNKSADASFESLKFSSGDVMFDASCASGELYMLPSDALEFVVHSDADFKVGQPVEPASQDAKIMKVLWSGNLITNNRRRLGKMTGVTA